jgi:hypothetical protein
LEALENSEASIKSWSQPEEIIELSEAAKQKILFISQ